MKYLSLLLIFSLFTMSYAQESAREKMSEALKKADAENKNVFVKYEASWCSWCKLMNKNMENEKVAPLFDANYVTVHMDVLENDKNADLETPGGVSLLNSHGGKDKGLPYWVIISPNGTILENSLDAKGDNLGSPASKDEVSQFLVKLQNTSNLNSDELESIREIFTLKK